MILKLDTRLSGTPAGCWGSPEEHNDTNRCGEPTRIGEQRRRSPWRVSRVITGTRRSRRCCNDRDGKQAGTEWRGSGGVRG